MLTGSPTVIDQDLRSLQHENCKPLPYGSTIAWPPGTGACGRAWPPSDHSRYQLVASTRKAEWISGPSSELKASCVLIDSADWLIADPCQHTVAACDSILTGIVRFLNQSAQRLSEGKGVDRQTAGQDIQSDRDARRFAIDHRSWGRSVSIVNCAGRKQDRSRDLSASAPG